MGPISANGALFSSDIRPSCEGLARVSRGIMRLHGRLQLDESAGGVIDLKSGVVKPETLMEHLLHRPTGRVAVVIAPDQHVR